jgi:thymidylate synthase
MTINYFSDATEALPRLLSRVMREGHLVDSRAGRTRELMMQQFTLIEPDPYITTPGRKVSLPAQIAETMWLLAGRNDIEWLSHYLPRAGEFSDDNKVWRGGYGPRLRAWSYEHDGEMWTSGVDQLAHIVGLLLEDPGTRRAVFTIYNPQIDNAPGKDVPCNNWVHFLPRDGVLHAHVAIRSNDLFWGWSGINAFEWTALLNVVAGLTGLKRGSVTFSISSLHLYERHWDKAKAIASEALSQEPQEFEKAAPEFAFTGTLEQFDHLVQQWFNVEAYLRDDSATEAHIITAIKSFPEPLLQSWLWVLYAWNRRDWDILSMMGFEGTSLYEAALNSPARKAPQPAISDDDRKAFTTFATHLHSEKNAAYGDSWKKRGEMLGIMANIARKVDRLGVAGGGDTSADTAIDLLMYLVKYHLWLTENAIRIAGGEANYTSGPEHVSRVNAWLEGLEKMALPGNLPSNADLIAAATNSFDELEHLVTEKRTDRMEFVASLARTVYPLAVRLWSEETVAEAKALSHSERNATRAWAGYES